MNCMKQQLNFTAVVINDKNLAARLEKYLEIRFPIGLMGTPYADSTLMKPIEFQHSQIYAPRFIDEVLVYQVDDVIFYLVSTVFIIYFIRLCSLLLHYDRQTWSTLAIISMILGIGNSRDPKSSSEAALFLCVLFIGFFFGGDLILNMTDLIVPQHTERRLESYRDLKESNLKVCLLLDPMTNQWNYQVKNNPVLINNLSYYVYKQMKNGGRDIHICEKDAILHKNTSFSINELGVKLVYGPSLKINDEECLFNTHINEFTLPYTYTLRAFSPYYHRFSDFYWKFIECGFTNLRGYLSKGSTQTIRLKSQNSFQIKYGPRLAEIRDNTCDESQTLLIIQVCTLLFTGCTIALVSLCFELSNNHWFLY